MSKNNISGGLPFGYNLPVVDMDEGGAFQGDVGIMKVDSIPASAVLQDRHNKIIAYGEATNHAHRFLDVNSYAPDPNVNVYLAEVEGSNVVFLDVRKDTVLFHEEHGPVRFFEGLYRYLGQYEYTYEGEFRKVAD